MSKVDRLSPELLSSLRTAIPDGTIIFTVSNHKPNWIAQVASDGVLVETEKSRREGSPPQLVPAWMVQIAWDELTTLRRLTQARLLHKLNVKRSAAVFAMLACLPGVEAVQRPCELRLK